VSVSEIGFTPGKNASSVRAFDNVETRKGYSGLYQFSASYNPGKLTSPTGPTPRSGNYLLYRMASQALWRVDPKGAKGLDATFAYDWSPSDVNRNNRELTAGLRFNEPLPAHFHNNRSVMCETCLAHSSSRPGYLRRPSTPLSSTLCWTFYQCSFCSLWSSTMRTWAVVPNALSFSDSEQRWSFSVILPSIPWLSASDGPLGNYRLASGLPTIRQSERIYL
jgi:hypothetical protein